MVTTTTRRPANDKGQFILPAIPEPISPELATIVADYRSGFFSTDDDGPQRWDSAAAAALAFEPRSTADLAAKLILAVHHRDPECDGNALAVEASEHAADRLAAEMELACLDHLLAAVPDTPANAVAWARAEADVAEARAALDGLNELHSDEDVDRLADIWSDAIDALLDIPAETAGKAVRKLELGMFDSQMVRSGVDYPALLAEARRIVGEDRQ